MSAVLSAPLGMYRASAFVYARSITFQPSGCPSPVQSFGSSSARNAALIRATVAASSAAGTCCRLGGTSWTAGPAGSRSARLR